MLNIIFKGMIECNNKWSFGTDLIHCKEMSTMKKQVLMLFATKAADSNGLSESNHDSKLQLYMIVVRDTLWLIKLWINKTVKKQNAKIYICGAKLQFIIKVQVFGTFSLQPTGNNSLLRKTTIFQPVEL